MPREHQRRGRTKTRGPRGERKAKLKRKREAEAEAAGSGGDEHTHRKRLKSQDEHASFLPTTEHPDDYQNEETPFYGMLDEEEQEYFTRADDMLELNQFEGPEERSLFLANVYKEANGKELRLANSQSCSRLMERLILMSDANQLKTLFQKFAGQ